jgi:hypothetical protein
LNFFDFIANGDLYVLSIAWQEMILLLSKVLEAGAWLIKGITLDGANSHLYVKEALFGCFNKLDPQSLADLPFWKDCEYRDLPRHALPRLPLKLLFHNDESMWCLPGPCNLDLQFFLAASVLIL